MYKIYICHVPEDQVAAATLAAALADQGFRPIVDGDLDDAQRASIADDLEPYIAVVVFVSPATAASSFVRKIVGDANRLHRLVLIRVAGLSTKTLQAEYGTSRFCEADDFDDIRSALGLIALRASPSPARLSVADPAVEPSSPSLRPSYSSPREGIGAAAEPVRPPLGTGTARKYATSVEGVGAAASATPRSAPVAAQQQEALAVEAGRLVHKIPQKMWVGEQETVEVRLGRVEAEGLAQGLVGRGALTSQDVPILETMSVSIYAKGGAFDIERQSETTQLVAGGGQLKGTPFAGSDFGRWTWLVTPRKSGAHMLFVRVSASLKDSRGLPTSASLPDREFPVAVSVNAGKATVRLLRRALIGIGGAIGAGLLGAVTQELWWPKLRDMLQIWGWLG